MTGRTRLLLFLVGLVLGLLISGLTTGWLT